MVEPLRSEESRLSLMYRGGASLKRSKFFRLSKRVPHLAGVRRCPPTSPCHNPLRPPPQIPYACPQAHPMRTNLDVTTPLLRRSHKGVPVHTRFQIAAADAKIAKLPNSLRPSLPCLPLSLMGEGP